MYDGPVINRTIRYNCLQKCTAAWGKNERKIVKNWEFLSKASFSHYID